MKFSVLITTAIYAGGAAAQNPIFYTVTWEVFGGSQFTYQSGIMVSPDLQEAGVGYLWPGLEPADSSRVLQNVLSGGAGTSWTLWDTFCCATDYPQGPSIYDIPDQTQITFSNSLNANGTWTSMISRPSTGESETDVFDVQGLVFDRSIFAIELWNGYQWDFGSLVFENITMVSIVPLFRWTVNR